MNFILIYELSNREYNNLLLLKRELERRGHRVYLCNKNQDIIIRHLKNAVALIPNSSHKKDLNSYRYKFNLGDCPIVIYSCEQLVNHVLPSDYDRSADNPVKKLPMFCWGNDYRDFIISNGADEKWTKITGAIQLDYCRDEFKPFYLSKDIIADKYRLPKDKKWILFISDFVYASEENYNSFKKAPSIHQNGIEYRHKYEKKTQATIVKWFEQLLKDHEDYIVIYRKHPAEIKTLSIYEAEKQYPGKFFEISQLNIKQWIIVSDRVSCYYSTAAIESSVAGKECLLLRPTPIPKETGVEDYFFFDEYPCVDNYDKLLNSLENPSLANVHKIVDSIKYHYDIQDKPAFIRVADELENVYKNYPRNKLERNYNFNRILYLIKTQYLLKVISKKIYRFLYIKFGIKPQKESGVAVKEWISMAETSKNYKSDCKKIDKIIDKFHFQES